MGTRYKSVTCEPFRAWNRLEPRTRKREFDQAIRAEIHDPLWMLARQWQFGEFRGEDTGSAIFAKIQIEHTRIKKIRSGNESAGIVNFDLEAPLEKIIESVNYNVGFKGRVRAGQHFLKLVNHYLRVIFGFDYQAYMQKLLDLYSLKNTEWSDSDPDDIKVQKANLLSNGELNHFMSVFSGKSPDGLKLYSDLKNKQAETVNSLLVSPDHRSEMLACVADYISWFEDCFDAVPKDQSSFWNEQKLEYQFACIFPEKDNKASVLVADEYASGHLDWSSFDIERDEGIHSELLAATVSEGDIKKETFSFIPTEASFAGMPNNRWWEFEDGKVDLGNITAETTDISKSVVAEYALIYGNDWFVVPYTLPVGSLSEINGLLVTDVFGQKTLIEAASQGQTDDWGSWGFFNLSSKKHSASQNEKCDTRLFLPPTLVKTHESDAIEEVLMLRDEMANMVWAIETSVDDLLNRGGDGHSMANEKKKFLHGEEEPEMDADPKAVIKYLLSNDVPENWIPFIPVHTDEANRAIKLQRASMPRKIEENHFSIRPRTEMLRFGFEKKTANEVEPEIFIEANKQLKPYFINEEEVPKTGVKISGKLQRSRWMNGKIISWYGYEKRLGRGEGSSGLQFDRMVLLKKSKENID